VALAPFAPADATAIENPYTLHQELQQTMNDLVGIIRNADELKAALDTLETLKERAGHVGVAGGREFNPGWHLALDLRNMLLVSECIAKAALLREESRGGHTRDDFPEMSPEWRKVNLVCSAAGDGASVEKQPMTPMREDLLALFQRDELAKYLTAEELPAPVAEEISS
jgi:succinate dehydrogenase / fumarate reductase flavoprotein subunit